MAFETGTASDFDDLLDKLVLFLTESPELVAAGQEYELIFDQTLGYPNQEPGGLNRRHVVFLHKGLSGLDEIYTAISTRANTANDYYNWRIQAGTGFNPAALPPLYPDLSQSAGLVNRCHNIHTCLFWDQPMTYWFFANGRRWWVIAKVATQYESCGAGFALPSTAPNKYPYPLAVWGSFNGEATRWSDTSIQHSGISAGRCSLRLPNGTWQIFQGYEGRLASPSESSNGQYAMLPTGTRVFTLPVNTTPGDMNLRRLLNMRDSPDLTFELTPVSLASLGNPHNANNPRTSIPLAEADGLFWCPVLNNGPEDVVQIAGVDYIIFQCAHNSGSPYLFALRAQ